MSVAHSIGTGIASRASFETMYVQTKQTFAIGAAASLCYMRAHAHHNRVWEL